MRLRPFLAALAAALLVPLAASGQPDPKFPRGAKRSPAHKILAAPQFTPVTAAPAQYAMVPPRLSVWGNDQYGCCVTSSEVFRKAAYSVACGLPETFVPEATMLAWARKYGFLNGAMLTDVMDVAQKHGFTADDGKVYTSGGYASVNYTSDPTLQSALTVGPVNIAIDSSALPRGAGNQQGWVATGGRPGQFANTDHCVAITGYGPAKYLFEQIHTPLPASVPGDKAGYLLFTWGTIGFVDSAWLASTCVEAWVQNPTTVGQVLPAPGPTPDPTPSPTPGNGFTGVLVYVNGQLVSVGPGPAPHGQLDAAAAGISPALFADILKLIQDVSANAGVLTIYGDLMKILADVRGQNEPAPPPLPRPGFKGQLGGKKEPDPFAPNGFWWAPGAVAPRAAASCPCTGGTCNCTQLPPAGPGYYVCPTTVGQSCPVQPAATAPTSQSTGQCYVDPVTGRTVCPNQQQGQPQYLFAPFGGRFRR